MNKINTKEGRTLTTFYVNYFLKKPLAHPFPHPKKIYPKQNLEKHLNFNQNKLKIVKNKTIVTENNN